MILSNVNIGTGPSAGDGDPLRSAFSTINNNFQILTNNVNALSNSVTSVAGRTGNVILTINDIVGLNTTYSTQANLTTANVGMRGYVDATVAANIAALVDLAPSTLDTIRELADAIGDDPNFAVNVALSVSSANTKMRGYVDGQITAANAGVTSANVGIIGYVNLANVNMKAYVDGQITAANTGVTSANLGIKGYVDQANTIQSAQVGAANLAIIAANLGMKGYVDSVAGGNYSNINTQAYLTTNSYATQLYVIEANSSLKVYTDGQITAANTAVIDANIGMLGYVFQSNATLRSYVDGQITAANAGVTSANLGMKGYVDSVASQSIYGNSNVASYLPTYSGNLTADSVDFNFLTVSDGPTGIDALHVGIPGLSPFGNCIASFHANVNAPSYINVHNKSTGDKNLAGFIATAYSSTNLERYNIALQVASEGFNIPIFPLIKPFDSVIESIGGNLHVSAHDIDFTPNKDIILSTGLEPMYEKVRVSNSSVTITTDLIPGANVTYSLGSITNQWKDLFVSNNTIYLGGVPVSITGGNLTVNGNAVGSYGNTQVDSYLPSYTGNLGAGNVTVSNTGAYKLGSGAAKISSSDNTNVELTPDTNANALAGVRVGGNGYLLGPNGSRNITLNYNGVGGAVGLQGNVTVGTAGSGNLFVGGNIVARDITAGNIIATGTSGVIGFNSGGFVQQATSNTTQVTSHTTSGNIQLMNINLGASSVHTVAFACNKLTTNDMLLVKHISGGLTSVYVDAYVASDGLAIIWIRDITGQDTGNFTPMLKYAIIRAPSA